MFSVQKMYVLIYVNVAMYSSLPKCTVASVLIEQLNI